jgi:hypothetical protein
VSRALGRPDDAPQWHEMAQHLVQAHGGDPGTLLSNGPALDQLRKVDAGLLASRTDAAA